MCVRGALHGDGVFLHAGVRPRGWRCACAHGCEQCLHVCLCVCVCLHVGVSDCKCARVALHHYRLMGGVLHTCECVHMEVFARGRASCAHGFIPGQVGYRCGCANGSVQEGFLHTGVQKGCVARGLVSVRGCACM